MEEKDLKLLLGRLSLNEKIAQLFQVYGGLILDDTQEVITGPLSELAINEEMLLNVGSALNSVGAEAVINIQKKAMANTAHAIPLAFMADICNGYKTIFPIPLGQGASWEPEMIEACCRVAAREASAAGVMVTYSPMVDLARDCRWGRVSETAGGEDPYLGALYAAAYVRGYQGQNGGVEHDPEALAVCVKHFAAYGACEAGRDYNTVDMSERTLRQYYLPAYKSAVDAGCEMVMSSFNIYDGVPVSANKRLLYDLLRGEWGFEGALVSDFGAVAEIMIHGAAADLGEAAEKALKAGVDIDMMTGAYVNHLKQLVNDGRIEESLIDESVLRVLRLKNKLGLFENPYRSADPEKEKRICLSPEHREVARKMAAKSCVLLKNDNHILPLSQSTECIALIGPFSGSPEISGMWSLFEENASTVTLYEGIRKKLPKARILSAAGCLSPDAAYRDKYENAKEEAGFDADMALKEALAIAQEADTVLLTLGESGFQSGEGGSRGDISLPKEQLLLLNEVCQLGKRVIVVLFAGRPLEIREASEKAGAILLAWLPGTEGGNGIADVLFGDENPAGRLPMSFPYSVGQCPVYYNHYRTGRPDDGTRYSSKYLDMPNEPLYPFGYGLSYTSFSYGGISLDTDTLTQDTRINASVTVKNTGSVEGCEVVQLYIADQAASVVRPVKELKGFRKIGLKPGEEQTVTFEINEPMLRFWDSHMQYVSEKGKFTLFIGSSARDGNEVIFKLI